MPKLNNFILSAASSLRGEPYRWFHSVQCETWNTNGSFQVPSLFDSHAYSWTLEGEVRAGSAKGGAGRDMVLALYVLLA